MALFWGLNSLSGPLGAMVGHLKLQKLQKLVVSKESGSWPNSFS